MIHARIDAVSSKKIVGFECGTRADFDARHGGDPLWVFLDYSTVNYQIRTEEFLDNPLRFFIDKRGLVQKIVDRKVPKDFVHLTDGAFYLRDDDGTLIKEPIYPSPNSTLTDKDAVPLRDGSDVLVETYLRKK